MKGAEEIPRQEILATAQLAAGVLPFFDNGRTILLGQEYRKRDSSYAWMEFGGKQEKNETLAETACREANEETAQTLRITLQQVQLAEQDVHYVDHYNEKTNIFYRMYCLKFEGEKPILETFRENAKGNEHVEKIEWHYFDTFDFVNNRNGILPETEVQIYNTMRIRLKKLKDQKFFPIFINEVN